MGTLNLSPSVLEWAANRIGHTLETLADEFAPRKRHEFLTGTLSVSQAEKLASKTQTPFGFLFLEKPPVEHKPGIPDLRQVQHAEPLSRDFYSVLSDIRKKQEWFSDYLKEIGAEELNFVGRFKAAKQVSPKAVAEDIRNTLNVTDNDQRSCANFGEFFSFLCERIESFGVLVFKSGIVQSNTRRGLSVKEFRGFALADPLVPIVFINGQDSEAAWIFSLVHELAHIWIGETGVSDISPAPKMQGDFVEQFCNKVAGEFLTPEKTFLAQWNQSSVEKIDDLSRYFKVSKLVIARRAVDLGKISWSVYQDIAEASKRKKGSGGNPYATIPVRNSKRFTTTLVRNTLAGHTMFRDAALLLNIKPNTVLELGRRMALREQA